jgi:hypothetical protein
MVNQTCAKATVTTSSMIAEKVFERLKSELITTTIGTARTNEIRMYAGIRPKGIRNQFPTTM